MKFALGAKAPLGPMVRECTLSLITGLAVSHLVRVLLLLLRERLAGWRLAVGVVLCVLAGAAAMAGAIIARIVWLAPAARPVTALEPFLGFWFNATIPLGAWAGLYFAITFYRNYRQGVVERLRLEAAVKDAELRAIKAQINPHFLFNSLNLLRALIPRELTQPREAVTQLADVLRASLSVGQRETVPLAEELETVASYLALEQMRYGARLRIVRHIVPDAQAWPVPPFLVQSLVENAVK